MERTEGRRYAVVYVKGSERTQKTQPKKGKPAEIPVPKREDVMRDLAKLARPDRSRPKK